MFGLNLGAMRKKIREKDPQGPRNLGVKVWSSRGDVAGVRGAPPGRI